MSRCIERQGKEQKKNLEISALLSFNILFLMVPIFDLISMNIFFLLQLNKMIIVLFKVTDLKIRLKIQTKHSNVFGFIFFETLLYHKYFLKIMNLFENNFYLWKYNWWCDIFLVKFFDILHLNKMITYLDLSPVFLMFWWYH